MITKPVLDSKTIGGCSNHQDGSITFLVGILEIIRVVVVTSQGSGFETSPAGFETSQAGFETSNEKVSKTSSRAGFKTIGVTGSGT